jgi:hypothetical protein
MSRFGSVIVSGILFCCFLVACGDKLLPPDPGGTGGNTTVPAGGSGGAAGTQTDTNTGLDAGTGACPGGPLAGVDASPATDAATGTSTTVSVTYTKDIQPLLKKYCTACHSPSGGQDPYLDSYSAAKANAAKALTEVQSGDMPPSGPTMSAAEVSLFKTWVNGPELQ